MPLLGPERLRLFALDALEEALAEADVGPVRRSWALRLALAYLASLHPRSWAVTDPYRDFWRALSVDGSSTRRRDLAQALATIYAWAGVVRDIGRAAIIQERARHQLRDEARAPRRPD